MRIEMNALNVRIELFIHLIDTFIYHSSCIIINLKIFLWNLPSKHMCFFGMVPPAAESSFHHQVQAGSGPVRLKIHSVNQPLELTLRLQYIACLVHLICLETSLDVCIPKRRLKPGISTH